MMCDHEINIFLSCKVELTLQINGIFSPKLSTWMLKSLHLCIIALHLNIALFKNAGVSVWELPSEFTSNYFDCSQ